MANAVVDGIKKKQEDDFQVTHLNILTQAGLKTAARYDVKLVPATILTDRQGRLLYRHIGIPDAAKLLQVLGQ